MLSIILTGHGGFASGMEKAMKQILGEQSQFIAIDFPETSSTALLTSQLEEAIAQLDCEDGIVFLTDLLGGTPFRVASTLAMQKPGCEVITGTNLQLLLEMVLEREGLSGEEFRVQALECGHRGLTSLGGLDAHQLCIADGVIAAIEPIPVGVTERDAELLCPAYIDTHVHGGAGVDVMDDAPDVLDKLAMHKAREGVGSWLPTTVTAPLNTIHAALKRIAQRCQRGGPGAQVLGSYLEGPYFTPQNKGAHPPELFRELEIAELDQLIAVSQHTLRVVALAPEKEGALQAIRHLKQQNVRVMLGHSAATWQQTRAAFDAGADGLVHCYNGMTGLHHREPGMVGAGLTDKRAWLELIADGHHVHPAAMSLCCCCAKERIVLITDAMQAAGMPDGRYTLCGEKVQMHGGVVRTASGGLAGSTLSVDAAVRNMVELTGVTPAEAIHMASLHPARMLGVDGVLGSLKPGKRASIVALDSGLHVQQIWIQSQLASF